MVLGLPRSGSLRLNLLKRPLPAYTLLLVLAVGMAGGVYMSLALTQGAFQTRPGAPDFLIATIPPTITAHPGSLAALTVRSSSLAGFAGSVNLTATQPVAGVALLVNPSSVSLFTGNATSTLSISVGSSTPLGTYVLNVTGASGKLIHIVQVFLTVTPSPPPDFSITASPVNITITRGSSATSGLTLTSQGGFTGSITISASVSPAVGNGPMVSLNPTSVTVPPGGSVSSLLAVSTTGTTPRQGYTIYVLATSGMLSHSTTINLTVQ